MCTFSVIVPVYNMEAYLERCIHSIMRQGYQDYELILVNDGSTDISPIICDAYSEQDSKIKVIHKPNGGLVSARNAGIAAAGGEYVLWVDADDWIAPDTLETVYTKALLPFAPDAVIFGAQHVFEDGRTAELPCYAQAGYYGRDKMESFVLPNMIYYHEKPFCKGLFNPMACNKIYRAKTLRDCHCRDEQIRMGEDAAFVFEALYKSDSLVVLDEVFYNYYKGNETSITSTYDCDRFRNNRRLNDYITSRIAGKEPWLDEQINALRAYLLFMAIFHEARYGAGYMEGCGHLKKEIEETSACDDIDASLLPLGARAYFNLVKAGLYRLALSAAYAGEFARKQR